MTSPRKQRVDRIVGNNVILTTDPANSTEFVLFGKGLGFSAKGQEWIDLSDSRIEKRYRLDEEQPGHQFEELVENIDPEVMLISENIIDKVKDCFGAPVQPKVYFALPNHIQFALYRLRNGMDITNPFLYETEINFPLEYQLAAEAAQMIGERFDLTVPKDEIGFLALHVHSCVVTVSVGQLVKATALLNKVVEHVEASQGIELRRTSHEHTRLILHLRAAIERLLTGKHVSNPLTEELRTCYPETFALAQSIADMIQAEIGVEVPDDEIGYITLHLYRML